MDAVVVAQSQLESGNTGPDAAHQLIDSSKDVLSLSLDTEVHLFAKSFLQRWLIVALKVQINSD